MTIDNSIVIRNIFYMLTYAFQQLRQNNYEKIACEEFDNIYDLFAEILSKGISGQLKQGLHREYIPHSETLSTIRGKINLSKTIKYRIQRSNKLECEFDVYTENNQLNQILKSTMLLLFRHAKVKKERKRMLKELLIFFSNIDSLDLSAIKWSTIRIERNNRTYQMLINICRFVHEEYIQTTENGGFKMRKFSDEYMNRLYEKFILEYYKKHHPELHPRSSRIEWNIEPQDSTLDIIPEMLSDITLTSKNRVLIIDAKYYGKTMQYNFNKASIHSHNLYQIFTYVTNHSKNTDKRVDGMLLYAKTQEEKVPNGEMKLKDSNSIYFNTLDLDCDFKMIKEQLERIAEIVQD